MWLSVYFVIVVLCQRF